MADSTSSADADSSQRADVSNDGSRHQTKSSQSRRLHNLQVQLDNLRRCGKIEQAAFLDMAGIPLASTSGLGIVMEDGQALIRTLKSPSKSLTRLRVGNQDFLCFKNTTNSLVGKSECDFLCVVKGPAFIVVGISDPQSPGSSIYEINRFLQQYDRTKD